MYIRPVYAGKGPKRVAYWAVVESYRTPRGPRQRTVAYVGKMPAAQRRGVAEAAGGGSKGQGDLFEREEPAWVEVDAQRVRVENVRAFGGPWLGLAVMRRLGLVGFLQRTIPAGRATAPWWAVAVALVLSRLCEPSSELHIAEHFYGASALPELLGMPSSKVNDDRLYRALDALRPHKASLEVFLKERLGTLFNLDYDLLLYDVTSTYFEGEATGNPLAQRGYSRDSRPDCKQVCIGLVVSRCGMPLGYEVFAGNRTDVTTVEAIVTTMERRYGRASRIWAMDRGMVSEANLEFLRAGDRRYIVGTPKSLLKQFERELSAGEWTTIRDQLEVKHCPSPDGDETFILCRSVARREKEQAMHARFEQRLEEGLQRIEAGCRKRRQTVGTVATRVGRLLQRNSRAARLFKTTVVEENGRAVLRWRKNPDWQDWTRLSDGCYVLRSNVSDWSARELWEAYMQLTEAEAAFRIQKSDLSIRPVWHQRSDRVEAHILVCFLAYVVWKALGQFCRQAGLGDEPRRVLSELSSLRSVDVVLPTRAGPELRHRCVTRPTDHQAILLHHLGFHLPSHLEQTPL